ncbi:MAG: hypothetical protein II845_06050 [Oscillospiraceae bacterium]|nr:hypothetical protein [Oscillospiraceae bacterium]
MRILQHMLSVFLILALGLFPVQSMAEAETSDWMTAYEQILAGWKAQTSEDSGNTDVNPELSYLVYDIDKDTIPELLVKAGTCEADFHGALYTFRNGQAVQACEELGLGHSSFYSDPGKDGIIMMWGHMGYASAVRISLTGGYREEPLYEDNLNERLEEDPDADYIYPGDVIPGSVYLTMCPGDLTLAMSHYEEISRCLAGVLPAPAEEQYPNQDEAFFENLISGNGEVFAVTADGYTNSPGWIGFQELLRQNVLANWMQGDLSILSVTPADLNGDGKLECCVAASDGGSEVRIILSEQNGAVFAYLINYAEGYAPDAEGNLICSTPYGHFRNRLIFDGEQAFLLSLPSA